jgi:hypothetical protein
MSLSTETMEMPIETKTMMTREEMLDFYHQKFTNYHFLQMSKDTLSRAAREASQSSEGAARVLTAKQNARTAAHCIDKAKNLDALEARLARARAKLAKKQ